MLARALVLVAVVLSVGALVAGPTLAAAGKDKKPEIGKPAPDFELPDCYGKKFKLSEFKDKVVVLEWINQNCPISVGKHNDKTMQNTLKKFADQGVVWPAIDSTWNLDAEKNRRYAAKQGLAYRILHDPDGRVGHKYAAETTPHMFVIDKKGKLVYDGAIDGQKVGKKDKNYVADAITAVLKGSAVSPSRTQAYGCGVKYKKRG